MGGDRPRPKVGLGVFVVRGGKILVGKRLAKDGRGEWALPGGHLEFGEQFADCAAREVAEETGLAVGAAEHVATENVVVEEKGYHYVVIFMRCALPEGDAQEPRNCEPDKCEGWEWRAPSDVPEPMFEPLRILLRGRGYDPAP